MVFDGNLFDGDFDFVLKLDRKIINNFELFENLKNDLLKAFNKENHDYIEVTDSGDFRLKKVNISKLEVDIDISFEAKNDKVLYSTDEALKDCLLNIKKQDNEKYYLVLANILLAKEILKEGCAYKNIMSFDNPQGGLGGIGVEYWIIQNGGSLKEAAETFLECSKGRSFLEFSDIYAIWNFGQNRFSIRENSYPHNNFSYYNMSDDGYYKMKKILIAFLKKLGYSLDAREYGIYED